MFIMIILLLSFDMAPQHLQYTAEMAQYHNIIFPSLCLEWNCKQYVEHAIA